MTSEAWISNLPLAYQTLFDPIATCEKALQKPLKEISAQFTWLNEIMDKNCRLFPGIRSGKTVVTDTAKINASSRPPSINVNSKTVCQQSKKAGEKSRNPVCDMKPLMRKQSQTCSSVQAGSKENRPPVRHLSDEKGLRNNPRTVMKTKTYVPATSKKTSDEKGADKRLCAAACELKDTVSTGVQRCESTAGKILVAAKLNTARRKGSSSSLSCERKSSGHQTANDEQNKESRWRNSTLKNGQLGKCKPPVNTCESQQVANVECNSHLSGRDKTNKLFEQRKYNRNNIHESAKMKGCIFNGIKMTHLQNQSLNETVTVVTEVFELMGSGQPARLKEFEIVKTKTAPAERVVKPDFTTMLTNNFSDRPSTSSDQGFNDDDCDQSVNASSEKSVTLSRKNSTNQSDRINDAEEEVGALQHPLRAQNTNEIVSTVTAGAKPSKDSGIETEIVKPAFVSKFTGHVKASASRTTTQKELANKKTAAEDTKRVMRMGQRQNGNGNFSKTRSSKNPTTEEKTLPQRPSKPFSNVDRNSMVLQKQKQQKLKEKETCNKEPVRKAAEMRKQKIDEQKKLREEKKPKDVMARELRTCHVHEQNDNINERLETKLLKEQVLVESCKNEPDMHKQSLQKQPETEANKKEEDGKDSEQYLENEEKNRVQEELMKRKLEHIADLKEKHKEEQLRLKQAKEAKEREREQLRIEKEKQIAYERAQQQRIEREKKEDRERKIKEECEKLKAMEKERLQHKQKTQIQHQLQKTQPAKLISKQKSSLTPKPPKASIPNTTAAVSNVNNNNPSSSYEMTPAKKNSTSSKSSDPDNYGIEDKFSDESTDDEEAPKKKIPEWATGIALNTALITQFFQPPDLEEIFRTSKIEPPNLVLVFPGRRKLRYNYRTSSANWNSPPLKQT